MGLKRVDLLQQQITISLKDQFQASVIEHDELTIETQPQTLVQVCQILRDDAALAFDTIIDICAVDYLDYGKAEWDTTGATQSGFSRGCDRDEQHPLQKSWEKPRFAVVYHLLSMQKNWRIRLKVFVDETNLSVPSVTDIWSGANWFEREAFDLFGILFVGHPDLRRLLTDYGFIGHPFRKDFPISGHVEMRYDAKAKRVVYEPVNIEPRVLVPRVIREDNRYHLEENPKELVNA